MFDKYFRLLEYAKIQGEIKKDFRFDIIILNNISLVL